MTTITEDDDREESDWCQKQRQIVIDYLKSQSVQHGRVGEWPAWHVTDCVAIWAIESHDRPEWIGWWVISGDLPTDYCSAAEIEPPQHPRKAVQLFADRWTQFADDLKNNTSSGQMSIGSPPTDRKLADPLRTRAEMLATWANDDSMWLNS